MTEITLDNADFLATIAALQDLLESSPEIPLEVRNGLVGLLESSDELCSVTPAPATRAGEVRFRLEVAKPLTDALAALRALEVNNLGAGAGEFP